MSVRNFVILLFATALFSCKTEPTNTFLTPVLAEMEANYNQQPTDENFNTYVQELGKTISTEANAEKKESLLEYAIDVCLKANKKPYADNFGTELIKLNPKNQKSKSSLWAIAEALTEKGNIDVSGVLYAGYANLYPEDSLASAATQKVPSYQNNIHEYIKSQALQVFENPGDRGLNQANTQKYIDLCEAYALSFPADTMASEYLFRASEMARSLGYVSKSMSLYDWITNYFPNDKNAPMALFLKGFTFENELKDSPKAKEIYDLFLSKYPNHLVAQDVKFLLQNLGKSDQEIMEQLEKTRKENGQK